MAKTRKGRIGVNTSNKRNETQKASDRRVIVDALLKGESMYSAWQELNKMREGEYSLSYSQIVYDVKVIERQWIEHYLADVNAMKAKELARIDRIEMAAWEEWERSKRTLAKTEKEQVENEQIGKDDKTFQRHRKTRAKKTEQERDADKEFMKIIQWCVEQRCTILGLNAAQRYDISWRKQAEAAGIDPEKLKEQLVDQFVDAARKGLND